MYDSFIADCGGTGGLSYSVATATTLAAPYDYHIGHLERQFYHIAARITVSTKPTP